jgi:hypothetical protein
VTYTDVGLFELGAQWEKDWTLARVRLGWICHVRSIICEARSSLEMIGGMVAQCQVMVLSVRAWARANAASGASGWRGAFGRRSSLKREHGQI